MKFTEEVYNKAEVELKRRRRQAEELASMRRREIAAKYPELTELEKQMRDAALEVIKKLSQGGANEGAVESLAKKNLEAQEKRKELLLAAGYPENYLEPSYTCEKCKDTGIFDGKLCKCHLSLLHDISVKELPCSPLLAKSTFDTFDLKYYSPVVDRETGVAPKNIMKATVETLKEYASTFSPSSDSWLFCGGTGLGKTHLALAVLNVVTSNDYSAYYDSCGNIVKKLEKEHFGRGETNIEDELEANDLLIIDDLGAEFKTSFGEAAVNDIVNNAVLNGKPIIIITNCDMQELEARYGQRLVSRLNGFEIAQFVGEDVRQLRK